MHLWPGFKPVYSAAYSASIRCLTGTSCPQLIISHPSNLLILKAMVHILSIAPTSTQLFKPEDWELFLTLSFSSNPKCNQSSSSISLSRGLVHRTHCLLFIQKSLLSSDYGWGRHCARLCLHCLLPRHWSQSSPDLTEEIASQLVALNECFTSLNPFSIFCQRFILLLNTLSGFPQSPEERTPDIAGKPL